MRRLRFLVVLPGKDSLGMTVSFARNDIGTFVAHRAVALFSDEGQVLDDFFDYLIQFLSTESTIVVGLKSAHRY